MANSVHRINSFGALTLISFILLAALCCSAGRASAQGKVRFPVSVASKTFGFSPSGQWRSRFHEPHTDGKQTVRKPADTTLAQFGALRPSWVMPLTP